MLIYFYTFKGHQTHPDPQYYCRGKLGETDRVGKLNVDSSEDEIYAQVKKRIKQQDNAAVSEAPIILGYWFVETTMNGGVDDAIREDLITNHSAKVTRSDKNKTEWIVVPGDNEADRLTLVERAIREFKDGELTIREMEKRELRGYQKEIAKSCVGSKSLHIAGCAAGKTTNELHLMETNVPTNQQVNVLCTSGRELANQICRDLMYMTTTNQAFGSRKIILVHSGSSNIPGIDATIDVEEMARQTRNANTPVWFVVVYNSVRTAARGIALANRTVHLKILDEVHRTTGTASTIFTDAVLLRSTYQRGFTASFRRIIR